MRLVDSTNRRAVTALLSATRIRDRDTETRASVIVERVRKGGDAALLSYARELDGLKGGIEVPRAEWVAKAKTLAPAVRAAIKRAAKNIRAVAKAQVPRGWRKNVGAGISVEQRVIPISRVGAAYLE